MLKKIIATFFILVSAAAPVASESTAEEGRERRAISEIQKGALLIDVRTPEEYEAGHLDGAKLIPHDELEKRISELQGSEQRSIVVYCRTGRRSGIAEDILKKHGFINVTNGGGYSDLKALQSAN